MENIYVKQNLKEIARFILVGLIATGIHYGIYIILIRLISTNYAYSIGYIISFGFNFFLSSYYTFKSNPTLKKGFFFGLSHLVNYVMHMVLLNFFIWLNLSKAYAPIPVFMIVIPLNFILVRTVFKSARL